MAARIILLPLCFLLLRGGGVLAQLEQRQPWRDTPQVRSRSRSECRIENLRAMEPTRRIESEAGVSEYWEKENSEELDCVGVAVARHVIQPQGLLLPVFSNAPKLTYIVRGRGYSGTILPGCPESYHSVQQPQQQQEEEGRRRRYRDQHQKVTQFRQGDIIATPAGVSHYCYNDGETPLIAVELLDTTNNINQLDVNLRKFHLAGNPRRSYAGSETEQQQEQRGYAGKNVLSGFDVNILAESMGVSTETARKVQSQEDRRGSIVRVEGGLQVVAPSMTEEEEEQRERREARANGLEQTICNVRLRHNIGDPERADIYSPRAGRITTLNSQKLDILNFLQLSAEKGVLYRNAILAPHWTANAHNVMYCTSGDARIQVVGPSGRSVYDGQLRQGQLLTIPQNFAVLTQAGERGFEWVAFKTSDNAIRSPLAGKDSVVRAMPEAVLRSSYGISAEEARRLKENRRQELGVFVPSYQSQYRGRAAA